ncbi:transglutaminase family protein [Pirellulaceae bacterium SH501]
MKKRDRRKRQTNTAQAASKLASTETSKELARPLRRYGIWTLSALCATIVSLLGIWSLSSPSQIAIKSANPKLRATQPKESSLPTLADLTMMSEEELSDQDIALLNLRATHGLPGAESVNVAALMAQLDGWAKKVKIDTDRNLYQFLQKPNEFNNSEAYFRMLMLVTVLQQDFGVHYNLKRVNDIDFTKSQDLFLHGMVGSSNGGTCVSMPVLYTAVARRLGYPVYLVNAKEHLFCRWDKSGERVNVEGTNRGMNSFADDHYMSWPHPIAQPEVDAGLYLKSLSNAESFAAFLAARGHCLEDSGNRSDAAVCYSLAVKHYPHPMYRGFLSRLVRPKTIDDFPELLAQQERLRQQRDQQFNQFGPPTSIPTATFGFGKPITPGNPNHDVFNHFTPPSFSNFHRGASGR